MLRLLPKLNQGRPERTVSNRDKGVSQWRRALCYDGVFWKLYTAPSHTTWDREQQEGMEGGHSFAQPRPLLLFSCWVKHRSLSASTAAQPAWAAWVASVKKLSLSVCWYMQNGSRLRQNHPLPQQKAKTKDNGTTGPPTSQTLPFTSDVTIAADRSKAKMRENKRFLPK